MTVRPTKGIERLRFRVPSSKAPVPSLSERVMTYPASAWPPAPNPRYIEVLIAEE